MTFILGALTGFVIALVVYEAKLVIGGPYLRTRMTPEVRERIRRMQEIGEHSLGKTIAHALAVYEVCINAHARNATVWIKEQDGFEQEMPIE